MPTADVCRHSPPFAAFCSLGHIARGRIGSNRENASVTNARRYVTMVSCLETSALLSGATGWP